MPIKEYGYLPGKCLRLTKNVSNRSGQNYLIKNRKQKNMARKVFNKGVT